MDLGRNPIELPNDKRLRNERATPQTGEGRHLERLHRGKEVPSIGRVDTVAGLPPEIWHTVLDATISPSSSAMASLTCRTWRSLVSPDRLRDVGGPWLCARLAGEGYATALEWCVGSGFPWCPAAAMFSCAMAGNVAGMARISMNHPDVVREVDWMVVSPIRCHARGTKERALRDPRWPQDLALSLSADVWSRASVGMIAVAAASLCGDVASVSWMRAHGGFRSPRCSASEGIDGRRWAGIVTGLAASGDHAQMLGYLVEVWGYPVTDLCVSTALSHRSMKTLEWLDEAMAPRSECALPTAYGGGDQGTGSDREPEGGSATRFDPETRDGSGRVGPIYRSQTGASTGREGGDGRSGPIWDHILRPAQGREGENDERGGGDAGVKSSGYRHSGDAPRRSVVWDTAYALPLSDANRLSLRWDAPSVAAVAGVPHGWTHLAARHAVETGHLDILIWLVGRGCPLSKRAFSAAIYAGRVDILVYLISKGCPTCPQAIGHAARQGDPEMMEWLHDVAGIPWEDGVCATTLVSMGTEGLEWLVEQKGCPLDRGCLDMALLLGDRSAVEWLDRKGHRLTPAAVAGAVGVSLGGYAFYEWINQRGGMIDPDSAMRKGLKRKDTEAMRWAADHGAVWDESLPLLAASRGDAERLQWLVDRGCPWQPRACLAALPSQRAIETLAKWIRERVDDGDDVHDGRSA